MATGEAAHCSSDLWMRFRVPISHSTRFRVINPAGCGYQGPMTRNLARQQQGTGRLTIVGSRPRLEPSEEKTAARTSSRSGIELPPVIVGCSAVGGLLAALGRDRNRWFSYLDQLADQGLRAFDLAPSDQLGGSERVLGAWLRQRADRDDFLPITKSGPSIRLWSARQPSVQALRTQLEGSLGRLRLGRIPLYLLSQDDERTPLVALAEGMGRFQQEGLIGAWGVSNWQHDRIDALLAACTSAGLPPPVVSSPQLSLFEWNRPPRASCVSMAGHGAALEFHRSRRLPILAWSPLGSGYLFAPYRQGGIYENPSNHARRQRLRLWAKAQNVDLGAAALCWLRSLDADVTPVVASRQPARLGGYLRDAERTMSPEDQAYVEGS